MRIAEILSPERIGCQVETSSKKSALEELSRLIATGDPSLSSAEIFDCLNARERLGSTGLGKGIAIPHGRLEGLKQPTAAFLQLKDGVDFDATDQKPVDLLFGLLVPSESTDEHLQILSSIAEMCSQDPLLRRLRLQRTEKALFDILTE